VPLKKVKEPQKGPGNIVYTSGSDDTSVDGQRQCSLARDHPTTKVVNNLWVACIPGGKVAGSSGLQSLQWVTHLLPVMRDQGSIPGGILM
jgi:hypothetical protein